MMEQKARQEVRDEVAQVLSQVVVGISKLPITSFGNSLSVTESGIGYNLIIIFLRFLVLAA